MTENIERARELNRQAYDDIDHGRVSAPHINLGVAYAWQGQLEEALQSLETALQCNPNSAEAYTNLGFVYISQGKLDAAITTSEKAIRLGDGGEAKLNLGLIYSWQGRFDDEAIALHKEALDIAPDSVEVQINLAFVYICQNRFDEAKVLLEGALHSVPESPEANTNLGIIYSHQGKVEEAIAAHRRAGAMAEAHNNLGIAYYQQGKPDAAIVGFKVAIEAENLPEAHTNLSILTDSLENIDASELQASPIGAPVGVPAVRCEFVN